MAKAKKVLGVRGYMHLHKLLEKHLEAVYPTDETYVHERKGVFKLGDQSFTTAGNIAACINTNNLMPEEVTAVHVAKAFDDLDYVLKFVKKTSDSQEQAVPSDKQASVQEPHEASPLSQVLNNTWNYTKETRTSLQSQIDELKREINGLRDALGSSIVIPGATKEDVEAFHAEQSIIGRTKILFRLLGGSRSAVQ